MTKKFDSVFDAIANIPDDLSIESDPIEYSIESDPIEYYQCAHTDCLSIHASAGPTDDFPGGAIIAGPNLAVRSGIFHPYIGMAAANHGKCQN